MTRPSTRPGIACEGNDSRRAGHERLGQSRGLASWTGGRAVRPLVPNDLLVTSAALLSELSQTLAYDRVRKLHGLDDAETKRFVDRVAAGSLIVVLESPLPTVVLADQDDDVVVATAVAGKANLICTRNKHLHHPDVVAYCAARSIRVVDDLRLLEELRALDMRAFDKRVDDEERP